MKKLLLITSMFLCFAGVVSASSINGDYKGNPIVKVKVNGKTVTSDVPAIIYDGSTMIPLRAAAESLGGNVSWDENTFTANITTNNSLNSNSMQNGINYITNFGGGKVSLSSDGTGGKYFNADTTLYVSDLDYKKQSTKITELLYNLSLIGAKYVTVNVFYYDSSNVNDVKKIASVESLSQYLVDFFESKTINENELWKKFNVVDYAGTTQKPLGSTTPASTSNTPQQPVPSNEQSKIKGPLKLYSSDGKTYLGKLTSNDLDSESVFNEYGTYGSEYATKSIWNEYGTYGSEYSNFSVSNELASSPPIIIDGDGKIVGRLTVNTSISGGVSPVGLKEFLESIGF